MDVQTKGKKSFLGPVDIFLIVLIILNLLDFFEIIGSELDYVKKIISWTLLGFLLYSASPTKVFFGHKYPALDITIILSYFALVVKNLISYAAVAINSAGIISINKTGEGYFTLLNFYGILLKNADTIETTGFMLGWGILILIAMYAAWKIPFLKRSMMGVLHEEGEPQAKHFLTRFFVVMLVFAFFFLFVFNMMMEWLAIAVDATLLLTAFLVHTFLLVRHKIASKTFLSNVGDIGSDFYVRFIDHFRYKESFLLGIAGILVLHLLTDIGIFLIPYITGLKDPLYFNQLGPGHDTVWSVFQNSLSGSLFEQFSTSLALFANIIAFVLLFISPAIIWYYIYRKQATILPKSLLIIFYTTVPAAIISPVFTIKRLSGTNLAGVDVLTTTMSHSLAAVMFMAVFFIIACLFVRHKNSKRVLEFGWVAGSTIFFGAYIWLYFLDIANYYMSIIFGTFRQGVFGMSAVFFIFLVLTIAFYVGGFLVYLYEVKKHHKHY